MPSTSPTGGRTNTGRPRRRRRPPRPRSVVLRRRVDASGHRSPPILAHDVSASAHRKGRCRVRRVSVVVRGSWRGATRRARRRRHRSASALAADSGLAPRRRPGPTRVGPAAATVARSARRRARPVDARAPGTDTSVDAARPTSSRVVPPSTPVPSTRAADVCARAASTTVGRTVLLDAQPVSWFATATTGRRPLEDSSTRRAASSRCTTRRAGRHVATGRRRRGSVTYNGVTLRAELGRSARLRRHDPPIGVRAASRSSRRSGRSRAEHRRSAVRPASRTAGRLSRRRRRRRRDRAPSDPVAGPTAVVVGASAAPAATGALGPRSGVGAADRRSRDQRPTWVQRQLLAFGPPCNGAAVTVSATVGTAGRDGRLGRRPGRSWLRRSAGLGGVTNGVIACRYPRGRQLAALAASLRRRHGRRPPA